MQNLIKPLLTFLLLIAAILYIYTIFQAGINSLKGISQISSFLSSSVIIIGGVLSTTLGAVLGVTISPPHAVAITALGQSHTTFLGLRSTLNRNINVTTAASQQVTNPDSNQKLQIIACWLYVIGLVIAAVFMLIATSNGNKDTDLVPLITELSKTLLGVLAGAVTVALGRT